MDSLIFLSGTAVFSTEQQPGSVLVALMGERGELLCTKDSEQALKATFGCLRAQRHQCLLVKELKLVAIEGQRSFLYQELQQGFGASAVSQQPPLYNSVTVPIVV